MTTPANAVAETASAVYWTNKGAQALYRKAQHLGMRFQNWRHKGAGENGSGSDSSTPATTTSGKPGKQWGSEESTTYFNTSTTMYVHTKKEK